MQRGPTTHIQIESTDVESLHYPDLQFKERYTQIRKENKHYKEVNANLKKQLEDQEVETKRDQILRELDDK